MGVSGLVLSAIRAKVNENPDSMLVRIIRNSYLFLTEHHRLGNDQLPAMMPNSLVAQVDSFRNICRSVTCGKLSYNPNSD